MQLGDYVYCVAVAFKMTEWVEQWICIRFCIMHEHSLVVTILIIQKATSRATGDWHLHQSNVLTWASCFMQSFWQNIKPSMWLSPDLMPSNFQLFPKLKLPCKSRRFQTIDEIQENMTGQLVAIGRTVWSPKVPTLKGQRCHHPMYDVSFLYLVSS